MIKIFSMIIFNLVKKIFKLTKIRNKPNLKSLVKLKKHCYLVILEEIFLKEKIFQMNKAR